MSQRGTERAARLIPWALWVLFSVCALAQGSTDGHRRDEATLQLSVSCTKTSFTENEPVVLDVKLINNSAQNLSIFGQLLWGHAGGLTLHVINGNGETVSSKQLDHDILVPSLLGKPSAYVILYPGHFLGVRREDTVENLFRRPGEYSVVAKYQSPVPTRYAHMENFWGREKGAISSEPLKIEVKSW